MASMSGKSFRLTKETSFSMSRRINNDEIGPRYVNECRMDKITSDWISVRLEPTDEPLEMADDGYRQYPLNCSLMPNILTNFLDDM